MPHSAPPPIATRAVAAMTPALKAALSDTAAAIEQTLDSLLPIVHETEGRVFDAMRYASLDGGKRLRPFLVDASAALFGVERSHALRVGAAVEMIHCYSLVHDDLPAMDNDDLRRGRPTTHRKFDEPTAILAGDGLLTYAFEVLADPATHPDAGVRCALVTALAKASGPHGMVGGQMVDLLTERAGPARDTLDVAAITRMHGMKTGCLIGFGAIAGAILGKATPAQQKALADYARGLGLVFQIIDDILDVEGDPALTGKSQGKDAAAGKVTFTSLLGLEGARSYAHEIAHQALAPLDIFGDKAALLRDVVHYVLYRSS